MANNKNNKLNNDQLKRLKELNQADIDAWHSYDQAISGLKNEEIRSQLKEFQIDHEKHCSKLSEIIKDHGEDPPEFSRDFKGFLMQGYAMIRGITGDKGVLEALHTNEMVVGRMYENAVRDISWPDEILKVLQGHNGDEHRHIETLNRQLREV